MAVQEYNLQRARSSDKVAAFLVAALAVLIFFVIGMGWGQSSARWVILIVIIYVIGWLSLRNQAYLVLVSVTLATTLPGIIFNPMLVLSGSPGNLRLEYLLFVLLIGLLMLRRRPERSHLPLDGPVAVFMVFQGISILSLVMRGDTQVLSVGPFLRLMEGYAFYYLASRLTSRDQIPSLVRTLTVIGGLVALVIILTTITGNQSLYIRFISPSTNLDTVATTKFYAQFFRGFESARIGYTTAEPFLLMTLLLSMVMILQVGWRQIRYSGLAFLVALRMLVSGQRFQFVYLAVALLLSPVMLYIRPAKGKERVRFSGWILLILLAAGIFLLLSSGPWAEKWAVLVARSRYTSENLRSLAQYHGIQLAWSEILHNPFAWLTGFSPFHVGITQKWDINLGFLLTLYYYGLGGAISLVVLLGASIEQALRLLRTSLVREERALICALVIFIAINIGSGFIRNMVFNELGISLIVFSICLGWIQVIWRDIHMKNTAQSINRQ
jgi:hypothetical protein